MSYNPVPPSYQPKPGESGYYRTPAKEPRVPSPATATLVFLATGILFIALGYFLSSALHWRSLWITIVAEVLIIAGVPFLVALVRKYDFKATFSLRRVDVITLCLCAIAGLATQFAVRLPDLFARWLLQVLLGPLYLPEDSGLFDNTVGGMLVTTFALLVLAPTCEELLNRGFLMAGFHQGGRASFWRTVIIIGLFFGAFHHYLYTFVGTALGGVLLAYVALSTGSIFSSMAAHFGFNFFPAFVYWVYLFVQDENGNIFGERYSDTGLMVINPEYVTGSIVISLFGFGVLLFLMRAITRRTARRRPGLVLGYHGLVRDYLPDSPYLVQGEYYSPGYPYLYGFSGYITEDTAPDYWQAPGITSPGVPVEYTAQIPYTASQPLPNGSNAPKMGRYVPPKPRALRSRYREKPATSTIVAVAFVVIFFAFTSLQELYLRAEGRKCQDRPRTCTAQVSQPDPTLLIKIR